MDTLLAHSLGNGVNCNFELLAHLHEKMLVLRYRRDEIRPCNIIAYKRMNMNKSADEKLMDRHALIHTTSWNIVG